ncbi:MAG: DUF4293 domain-containing protein [Bacteroidales bacterium]|jgi:hypothetical protein|nr:DUF4293 domain-containing protein [Bacteroidales bacterium]MCI1785433.1 DUF4293 domain-containing protein [Bacteroidales bacterium]
MWQRIQTLYLSVSTCLIAILLFSHLGTAIGTNGKVSYVNYVEKIPYLILICSILAADIIALITFRFRMFQMRIAVIAALLSLGFQIWIAVDYFKAPDGLVFRYTAIFPLIACIMDFLAAKGILSDQLIVESASHLRAAKRRDRENGKKKK